MICNDNGLDNTLLARIKRKEMKEQIRHDFYKRNHDSLAKIADIYHSNHKNN